MLGAVLVLSFVAAPPPARAAETQWWSTDRPDDYAKSEAHGIVIRPDGALELGPAARFSAAESLGVVWSVVVMKDGAFALAGYHGTILRFTELVRHPDIANGVYDIHWLERYLSQQPES